MTERNETKRIHWVFIPFLVLMVLIPMGYIYLLNNDNPYEKYIVEKYVPEHLEKMGVKASDMERELYVQPKHLINNDFYQGHYYVTFKDDPKHVYYYGVKKKGKDVVQFCEKETVISEYEYGDMTTKKTTHSEPSCAGYYDNRD